MLQSYTDRAKTKYKKRPDLLPQVELIPDIPTPEGLDQLERLDHAIKLSAQLVKEAHSQITQPRIAPDKLTLSEKVEKQTTMTWNSGLEAARQVGVNWGEKLDALVGAVSQDIAALSKHELLAAPTHLHSSGLHLVSRDQLGLPAFVQRWLSAHWTFRERCNATLEAEDLEKQLKQNQEVESDRVADNTDQHIKLVIARTPSILPSPSSPEPSSPNPATLETHQAQQDFPRSPLHPNPLTRSTPANMSTDRLPSPSPVDVEATSTIDLTMQLAREKVLARLERLQTTTTSATPSPPPLTEEEQELEERIERCTEMTDSLLAEAQAYLRDTSAREIARAETRRKRLSSGMLLARLTTFEAKVDADMSATRTMQLLAQQEERSFQAADAQSWHDWE